MGRDTIKGVFTGWAAKALGRATQRGLTIAVGTARLLGTPRVCLALQRETSAPGQSERAELAVTAKDALLLGTEILAAAVAGHMQQRMPPSDVAEAWRERLALGAAYLLAKVAHDAGRPREFARAGIEHALAGCLWNGERVEQIATLACELVWTGMVME